VHYTHNTRLFFKFALVRVSLKRICLTVRQIQKCEKKIPGNILGIFLCNCYNNFDVFYLCVYVTYVIFDKKLRVDVKKNSE